MMELGLQTFTLHKLLLNPSDLDLYFGKLAAMGLRNLELAVDYLPLPFTTETARTVAGIAEKHGLRMRSCQIKYATSSKNTANTIAYMQALGAELLINSTIDLKLLTLGKPGLLRICASLDRLKEQLAPAGILLAHHNHHFEFRRVGGQTALAFMAKHASIDFALDTYWVQRAGGDILALLEEMKGRVPLMHLRDFAGKADCEIGRGNLSFPAIIKAANTAGVRFGMVEQKTKTPMESIQISLRALGVS